MIVSKDKNGYNIMLIPYDSESSEVVIRLKEDAAIELCAKLTELLSEKDKIKKVKCYLCGFTLDIEGRCTNINCCFYETEPF